MVKKVQWLKVTIFILVLPLVLRFLFTMVDCIAMLPYLIYQLYCPLGAWLGTLFFDHDSELGILVLPLGAVVTAIFYVIVVIVMDRLYAWFLGVRHGR